jgi:2,4-dienoyl-CoA reductase-like NADH-dependent reductase (Old Yellow Enzyme family)
MPGSAVVMRKLSVQEIEDVIAAFGQSANLARSAGFDSVEIHGAHGHLVHRFASPLTNKRTDRYGGSLRNRTRLPLEIVAEVRNKVGAEYPILYRLGADHMLPGGLTIQDARRIAIALVEGGVNALDVSGGFGGSRHPTLKGQGYFIPVAQEIRRAARVPVICAGGITKPAYADRVIREGRVDMVAVGRAILNEPGWDHRAIDMISRNQEPG